MLTNNPEIFDSRARAAEIIAHGKILDRIDNPFEGRRSIFVIDTWTLRLNPRNVQDFVRGSRQLVLQPGEDGEDEAAIRAAEEEARQLLDDWTRDLCADLGVRPEGVTIQQVAAEFFCAVRIAKIAELPITGAEPPAPETKDNYIKEDEI